jgi:hypothetical protein
MTVVKQPLFSPRKTRPEEGHERIRITFKVVECGDGSSGPSGTQPDQKRHMKE